MAKKAMTKEERVYLGRIKELPCSCCNAAAPSIAHHIRTGKGLSQRSQHWLTIPLCESCHVDNHLGIHGGKAMMRIMDLSEMDMLAKTISMLNK